jgi:hypothetical protein
MLDMQVVLELQNAINAQLENTALLWDHLCVRNVLREELSREISDLELELMCLILPALQSLVRSVERERFQILRLLQPV